MLICYACTRTHAHHIFFIVCHLSTCRHIKVHTGTHIWANPSWPSSPIQFYLSVLKNIYSQLLQSRILLSLACCWGDGGCQSISWQQSIRLIGTVQQQWKIDVQQSSSNKVSVLFFFSVGLPGHPATSSERLCLTKTMQWWYGNRIVFVCCPVAWTLWPLSSSRM